MRTLGMRDSTDIQHDMLYLTSRSEVPLYVSSFRKVESVGPDVL